MINMEPLRESHRGDNCFTTAVSNILKYITQDNLKHIWKQCGFNYICPEKGLGYINAKYMSIEEELALGNNIVLNTHKEDEKDMFIQKIKENIEKGQPCILFVNTFDLPFSMYYQEEVLSHCITIIDFNEENAHVIDDFYTYKGWISWDELMKAANYEMGWPINIKYSMSFCTLSLVSENYHLTLEDYLEIISLNRRALNGELSSDFIRTKTDISTEYPYIFSGIPAMEKFSKDCAELLDKIDTQGKDFYYSLYMMLTQISNSRYLYGNLLLNGSELDMRLKSLGTFYNEIAQDWKVASNIMLKGYMANLVKREELISRMVNKVNSIIEKERKALYFTNDLLDDYYRINI